MGLAGCAITVLVSLSLCYGNYIGVLEKFVNLRLVETTNILSMCRIISDVERYYTALSIINIVAAFLSALKQNGASIAPEF